MDSTQHLSYLRADMTRVADAIRAGRDRPVPSCPGWTIGDLAVHLGALHRLIDETVTTGATERPHGGGDKYGVSTDAPDLAEWYEDAAATLLDTLSNADLESPVWSFGSDRTVRFWVRRQAHEVLVHRWDAQNAVGAVDAIDPEHAADAVDELVMSLLPLATRPPADSTTRTFHLHRTDGPGEWFVTLDAAGYRAERAHEKGDVAIRGGAADLLLFVWHRRAERLEAFGTDDPTETWFSVMPTF